MVQELLNNISKHAGARQVVVTLEEQPGLLTLSVSDDGIGITEPVVSGFGLRGIEERVRALGGDWQLLPPPGTCITVNLPTKSRETAP